MRLLLDLGNTRLKWAAVSGDAWLAHGAVDWSVDVSAALAEPWRALSRPRSVVSASVVAAAREQQIAEHLRQLGWPEPRWLRTPAFACGVRNAYAQPQRLGVDRFLAMVDARARARSAAMLIGVGTALTLDALTGDGIHLGGLIAPGPLLMQRSLLAETAQVRPQQTGRLGGLADNTADAVVSGCWGACAGLVERFVREHRGVLGGAPRVLLSGGDAPTLQPLLDFPSVIVVDAVLHGLSVWAAENLADSLSHGPLAGLP